jgi:CubicO group peptidase (beta-lactamase class C family)
MLLTGLAGAALLGGCASRPLSRMVRLRAPDIEDYRRLPHRPVAAGAPQVWPERREPDWPWRTGLSYAGADLGGGDRLDRLLARQGTTAFLVIAGGAVVDERYFNGYGPASLCKSFSVSKSVLSALFGIARGDGLLDPGDTIARHLPDLAGHPAGAVTLDQLLGCTAGFAYRRGFVPWADQPRMYYTDDVRRLVRGLKLAKAPGTAFVEEDYSPLLLGVVLEAALRTVNPAETLSSFTARRLWTPMGAGTDALWVIDRPSDGFEKTESGFVATARDLARFGQLFLDRGRAGGSQVVPADWVQQCAAPPPGRAPNRFTDGYLRNFWWGRLQPDGSHHHFANGHFGQRIYIAPDKDLVLVRLGARRGDIDWTAFLNDIAARWRA